MADWNMFDWFVIAIGCASIILHVLPRIMDFLTDTCYEGAKRNSETVGGLSDKYFYELVNMPHEQAMAFHNATTNEEKSRIVREYRESKYFQV